jgi:hypothetical protein
MEAPLSWLVISGESRICFFMPQRSIIFVRWPTMSSGYLENQYQANSPAIRDRQYMPVWSDGIAEHATTLRQRYQYRHTLALFDTLLEKRKKWHSSRFTKAMIRHI